MEGAGSPPPKLKLAPPQNYFSGAGADEYAHTYDISTFIFISFPFSHFRVSYGWVCVGLEFSLGAARVHTYHNATCKRHVEKWLTVF